MTDNIQQLQSVNQFMAQLSAANVLQKVKELNAFDDLHDRLKEVTVLRADIDRETEKLETIDARTLKEAKNFKFDMGVFQDKHEHLVELVEKNADKVEMNKKEVDLYMRRFDGNIENLKQQIANSAQNSVANVQKSGPSFKMEDLFNHSSWKKIEEFEEFARGRFADMEYKIQHVDINSLDTSAFVKQHEFDQAFRKLYVDFEDIKTSSMTNGEVFKKYLTKADALDLIKKGVLFHINNDVRWEGVESFTTYTKMQLEML